MSIGAGGLVRAAILGLALAAAPVAAQTSAGGTWTDPPARAAAPTPPVAATTNGTKLSNTKDDAAKSVETKVAKETIAETKPATVEPTPVRRAAVPARMRSREVRRVRPRAVAEAVRVRPRLAERRASWPARRVAARSFAPQSFAPRYVDVRSYGVGPMPVGRVEGPVYGERSPIFDEGDDRTRRIAAAQAAGYLVVRSRSVQFPDGRMLRTYRPYAGEDDRD